ncbi:efflux RND transporter permease subunit [Novosphingobium resinovorum]|uniref:Efflux pump membrane transporter n=4 Tax=Sphingomonadaceae TaxID=41297 RepID=A0A031JY99_9SPHN|nr:MULTISPECIES: efflux RND transporter permease subunit [Novosphingobium]AOR78220.1 multidrug efflux RND transporter permease [Novosphingobium resinovorum]EZP81894.1 Multidrug transporter [Novosphingobium resinovorum]MBF7010363.1 multidrug efflux RND transporter permease subunit [Novosphingobium sp. HR1a]WJM28366.1 efflux RND transporter permease subunit [Novosphingobium resinovorum]
MSRYFIDRPIFAWVIAIVLMMAGIIAIRSLPVAQFPEIAPPTVSISATYPGADAETLERTTTQIIEQQLKGIDNLRYFSAASSSAGTVTITLTFEQGTDPDIAQVQVQNKLQAATPLLPQEVQRQGVQVQKSAASFLLVTAIYSEDGSHSATDLADYLVSQVQDPVSRINGVGELQIFGTQYAMRIWVDPLKLRSYDLTIADVTTAISAQNAQVSAGQIGALPAPKEQMLNATVSVQSRLQTPEEFGNIRLRSTQGGATVRLRDVARVELGAELYGFDTQFNGKPASGFGVRLASGANALDTVDAVKAEVQKIAKNFPSDVKVAFPYDSTPFVRLSIEQVVHTLVEAVVLVFLVMFLFLQNWRATLIPTIAVPVVLLGTFGVMSVLGYSINTLTLFGMVLAIGLLVDDAIVVVENVERLIQEEHLSPKQAARKSMDEISGALVGIGMVLSAVFLPMAFFGGSTGVIYRQFSITIVSSMALSVMVALILTPALCATILKPHRNDEHQGKGLLARFFRWFNDKFDRGTEKYRGGVRRTANGWKRSGLVYLLIVGCMVFLFTRLPGGFLPDEDQGVVIALVQGPSGGTLPRTQKGLDLVNKHFLEDEKANVVSVFTINGFSFSGQGQNAGMAFVMLRDWKDRGGAENRAPAIVGRAMGAFSKYRDAMIFALTPPAVQELGNATGFDMWLVDETNMGHDKLLAARNQLLGMASQDKRVAQVRPVSLDDAAQLDVKIDQDKAAALGLDLAAINSEIGTAWGGSYVNDFLDRGRTKRVYIQADQQYRSSPEALSNLYVRGTSGQMAPFSAFSELSWKKAPVILTRYNGRPAMQLQGAPGQGLSTGGAMQAIEEMQQKLPAGTGIEWTGLSYEERLSGGQAPMLYALSLAIVFLCLAALYESWSVPIAVMLVVPLGVVGALFAAWLTGLGNDIYLQVGLITTIGVSAKNAILIVEFAEERVQSGMNAFDAAMEAARLRLRPILMTSLAFVFGVLPLAVSTGAGAGGQNAIGRAVVGGMLSATIFAIFFVPMFFVVVARLFKHGQTDRKPTNTDDEPHADGAHGAAPQES